MHNRQAQRLVGRRGRGASTRIGFRGWRENCGLSPWLFPFSPLASAAHSMARDLTPGYNPSKAGSPGPVSGPFLGRTGGTWATGIVAANRRSSWTSPEAELVDVGVFVAEKAEFS